MRSPFDAFMVPAMRGWVSRARENMELLPRPTGVPQVHADGPSPDRILMIGSGAAVGFGVFSYDLSLSGTLARSVAALTHRGVDIDVIARAGMTPASALDRLTNLELWRYDAVIVALGLNEAVGLVPLTKWRRELGAILDHLAAHTSPTTEVCFLGVPPIRSLPALFGPLGLTADRHAHKLDAVSAQLRAAPRTQFIPLTEPVLPAQVDVPRGEDYRVAGEAIAEFVVPALNRARDNPDRDSRLDDGFVDEPRRQLAVDSLVVDSTVNLERIVELARGLFGTEAAILSVVDGDMSRHPVHVGVRHTEVPRIDSFCAVTIKHRGAMIIPDARADARFAENPYVVGDPHIRFYAGFPIESPQGEPIGALCVLDPTPRESSQVDEVLLRSLALQLQQELYSTAVLS